MKKLTITEFNACKSRPCTFTKNKVKIKPIAVIGTSESSLKEIYVMIFDKPINNKYYFVQRFVKDNKNENMIIYPCKFI